MFKHFLGDIFLEHGKRAVFVDFLFGYHFVTRAAGDFGLSDGK